MPISELCNREVIIIQKEECVLEAAKLMRQHHVGNVIIVEEQNDLKKPIGIVTDRDLVVEIMATELDPTVMTVGDITVPKLVTVQENTGVFDVIQYMRRKAIRRAPVVDDRGGLIGIITLDDLLHVLSEELSELATLARDEIEKEIKLRP